MYKILGPCSFSIAPLLTKLYTHLINSIICCPYRSLEIGTSVKVLNLDTEVHNKYCALENHRYFTYYYSVLHQLYRTITNTYVHTCIYLRTSLLEKIKVSLLDDKKNQRLLLAWKFTLAHLRGVLRSEQSKFPNFNKYFRNFNLVSIVCY